MGLYAAAFGLTFGAVATGSGLTVGQAAVLSVVMFSGASQFALAGVVAAGGSGLAAIGAALLLGLRNSFYGVPVTEILRPRGLRRLWTAHFVIDETTGMAVAQPTPRAARYAFWVVGLVLFIGWAAGTLAGAVVGRGLDTEALGLDAAAPAIFLTRGGKLVVGVDPPGARGRDARRRPAARRARADDRDGTGFLQRAGPAAVVTPPDWTR